MSLVPVILAAGGSSRMGRPKALLEWGGRTFLSSMTRSLGAAGLSGGAVVVGGDADVVCREVERLGLVTLLNDRWRKGRMSSVRLAARHASAAEGELLLWPVDCPAVSAETLRTLFEKSVRSPGANLVPSHRQRGGHPVVLSAATCRDLQAAGWDSLRDALQECDARRCFVDVADSAVLDNVDTPDDYEAFLTARGRRFARA